MPLKITYIFDYSSEPADTAAAASHKGGWSETLWLPGSTPELDKCRRIASQRTRLLPETVRIIGYRQQLYTIVAGQFQAGGANMVLLGFRGRVGYRPDLPQVSLSLKASAFNATNTRRFTLRGIPDEQMENGEYQPTPAYDNNVTLYGQDLVDEGFAFPGRKLDEPFSDVKEIVNSKLKVVGATTFNEGDRVLLKGVRDVNGDPVVGQFVVTGVAAGQFTLGNMDPNIVVGQKGRVCKVINALFSISQVETGRAVVRKIGRPFEQYRGRRSKRR